MASAMNPELAQAIIASSRRLGVDPLDIATAMSYETGGKFDPALWGGKNGNHLGLIQFGAEERKKYGVHEGQSAADQVTAAENYLRDRGVKPGMGISDIYSTINAGSPGRYNASDAASGGAPGTVMDKVTQQMGDHRINAAKLLGMPQPGMLTVPPTVSRETNPVPAPSGVSPPIAPPVDDSAFMASLANIPKMLQQQQAAQVFAPAAPVVDNLRARMAAIAAARQGQAV